VSQDGAPKDGARQDDARQDDARQDDPADTAGALDMLLADAALGPARRFVPGMAMVRFWGQLARQPAVLALRLGELGAELGRVAAGRSQLAAGPKDRRFADPAWASNPVLHRILQAYLAGVATLDTLQADADLDWADQQRVSFLLSNLAEALAPSNNPLLNPAALKALIDTGGGSALAGARHLAADLATAPRVPAMVEPDAFAVGADLAVTPGTVVLRTPVFELIQYAPVTETVHERPLLIVPPVINKYYITDLAPGRSMVEYLVSTGQPVFMISWRNPDARHRHWRLGTYGAAILAALAAAREITGADAATMLGVCSGGILAAMVLAHLAHAGQDGQVAGLALAVTVLDQARAGLPSALTDQRTAQAAIAASAMRGYLDGAALAEIFAWLKPGDLIWNYWVNNYLLGRTPPPFDILFWNADTTRMPAGVHKDFIELALDNALTVAGKATMLGSPVDLSAITTDAYVVAGAADHLCPWQSCYRSTQLLGGSSRFVLARSGHIASMVSPVGNAKAEFRVAADNPADPEQWRAAATVQKGSWWPDFAGWLAAHGGAGRPAPPGPGSEQHPPVEPAPGSYVFDR
jgi:polyhydroxyalkanoate synthase subunit PhaC